jgi:ATP-binding cassette subfamily A (ABC1) protein 3
LDEANVLADHVVIVHKECLVCDGPGTSLKARFGENYAIRSDSEAGEDTMVWRTSNSAEATRKILELEALTEDTTYNVVFPTLEQVFLKVTWDSNTAVLEQTGDGLVDEEETRDVINEKIFALEPENARDIDLDVGHSIVGSSVTLLTQSKLIRGLFFLGPSEKPVICSSCSSD